MVTKSKIDVDELIQTDRVHSSIYTDPDIFALEMEKIFYRTWVYIAHESEIAHGGDYKTTYIGKQPVIVTRNADDNQISVLFNRCRHRGATVCQSEYGNGNFFRCEYHGFTYNNQGHLIGVPFKEAFGSQFRLEDYGLVRVPRVSSYGGFIFANLSQEGPDLEEYLGNARKYIDYFAGQGPEGIQVGRGVHKNIYHGNWKLQMENVVDHYHFPATHVSLNMMRSRGAPQGRQQGDDAQSQFRWSQDVGNGHAVNGYVDDPNRKLHAYNDIGGFKIAAFPNLILIDVQIRHIIPMAVDKTQVWVYPVLLKGQPELNEKRLRKHEDFYGAAGFGQPDDLEMFNRVQAGLQATESDPWVLFLRGLEEDEEDPEGGVRAPASLKPETTQRAIYKGWKYWMSAPD
jgi:phenylpropionate dioxygenase-like ring-hydroxylating dioxygenase large terminal subunit